MLVILFTSAKQNVTLCHKISSLEHTQMNEASRA